jgi:peptide deformylase
MGGTYKLLMAKLVPENHPALHTIAEEITDKEIKDGTVSKILKDMKKALLSYNVEGFSAVAIAAPQIGVSKRIFLINDQNKERDDIPDLVAINPKIIKVSKRSGLLGEGCLSVPDYYGLVRRHKNVTLRAVDENGTEYERGAGGLLAQIFQHECDHLDGILFTERADKLWHKDELKSEEGTAKHAQ